MENKELQWVNKFCYLVVLFTSGADIKIDIAGKIKNFAESVCSVLRNKIVVF